MTTQTATEDRALSIKEFCVREGISPNTFHRLRAKGEAPASYLIGAQRRIPESAYAAYREAKLRGGL